jgi:hypothetical protein
VALALALALALEDPLIPTGAPVRAGVHRVADALAAGGARVERHSPLPPDLTEAPTLCTQLLLSSSVVRFPLETAEAYAQLRPHAAGLRADDRSLDAARLRGMVFSHRDWIEANSRRGWRELFAEFDVVVCPITPTPAGAGAAVLGRGGEEVALGPRDLEHRLLDEVVATLEVDAVLVEVDQVHEVRRGAIRALAPQPVAHDLRGLNVVGHRRARGLRGEALGEFPGLGGRVLEGTLAGSLVEGDQL